MADEKKVGLEIAWTKGCLWWHADPDRVLEVLINLVGQRHQVHSVRWRLFMVQACVVDADPSSVYISVDRHWTAA